MWGACQSIVINQRTLVCEVQPGPDEDDDGDMAKRVVNLCVARHGEQLVSLLKTEGNRSLLECKRFFTQGGRCVCVCVGGGGGGAILHKSDWERVSR